MRRTLTGMVVAGVLLTGGLGAQQRPQDVALQAAIRTETVGGDLRKAIAEYRAIVDRYSKSDRAVAANALLRMAECHQKLGEREASALFKRIVAEFADQKEAVSAAIARLGRDTPEVGAVSGVLNRQVWTGSDVDSEGTLSLDGRYLSFVDWGTGDLAVRDMTTGAKRRLTNKGPWEKSGDFAEDSAFSRDGSQIAYAWFNNKSARYELRIIRADAPAGMQPRVLFDNPDVVWVAPFDWTPDGKRVAVQVQRRDRTAQIGLIAIADGSFVPLQSTDWRGSTRLFLSPEGSSIAFDLPDDDQSRGRDVFVIRLDGTAKYRVAPHPGEDMVVGWSPDGKVLLFASDRAGSTDLWSVPIANGQPGSTATLLRGNVGHLRDSVGLDRSGGLVYAIRTSASTIATATLDLAKGTVTAGPTTPFENYFSTLRGPDWSKDGTLVAVSEQSRTRLSLTFRTPDGRRLREVSLPMGYAFRPRWAPDGTVTLQGVDLKGRQGIYRVDADSGELTPLVLGDPPAVGVLGHAWLPSGDQLLFQRNTENGSKRSLVLRNVRTGEERTLLDHPRLRPSHTISPDGLKVAYVVEDQQAGTTTLNSLDIANGTRVEIMSVARPAQLGGLSLWTADGRSILFSRVDKDKPSLWIVSATGGSPRAVNLELGAGHGSMRMHPDGQRVAYNTGTNTTELWRLDSFLPRPTTTSTKR